MKQSQGRPYQDLPILGENDRAKAGQAFDQIDTLLASPSRDDIRAMVIAMMGEYSNHGISSEEQLETKITMGLEIMGDVPAVALKMGMIEAMRKSPRFMPSSAAVRETALALPEIKRLCDDRFVLKLLRERKDD